MTFLTLGGLTPNEHTRGKYLFKLTLFAEVVAQTTLILNLVYLLILNSILLYFKTYFGYIKFKILVKKPFTLYKAGTVITFFYVP